MFELMLMRHAKSDWQYDLDDIDRPLNDRGRRDAQAMGRYLRQSEALPTRLLVSPAQRSRETAELLLQSAAHEAEVVFDKELYLAAGATLLELAEAWAGDGQRLLILAHNPGMDDAVSYLAASAPALSASGKLMSTCALARFQIDDSSQLQKPHRAKLLQLLRPAELNMEPV